MDIFTAEFDKATQTFGPTEQLTDDAYYDDMPLAVYDAKTGDYIIIYNKSAQDDEKYDNNADKLMDLVSAGPNPGKTYSVVCYMLYNNQTGAEDTNGQTHAPGWARDYLFPLETDQTLEQQAAFLAAWGGQRFLDSALHTEDGGQVDPPINDLTAALGYNGLATFAFTVDKDYSLNTAEDRELYVQMYDFETHGVYVPIKVGGTATVYDQQYDSDLDEFVPYSYTQEVEVGTPKLIRNGGSTFLFWRENGETLKYLNISEMLNDKVATKADPGESDWTYAVKEDGTFATDAATGLVYEPQARKVDFGSALTADDIHITDYEVVSDEADNLYVVWTDAVTYDVTNEIGETYPVVSQEIYASAMIHQPEVTPSGTDEEGNPITSTTQTVRWSKPNRLTKENKFNDGLALTIDKDGNLVIVHNE